jgi:hypothetical protein
MELPVSLENGAEANHDTPSPALKSASLLVALKLLIRRIVKIPIDPKRRNLAETILLTVHPIIYLAISNNII